MHERKKNSSIRSGNVDRDWGVTETEMETSSNFTGAIDDELDSESSTVKTNLSFLVRINPKPAIAAIVEKTLHGLRDLSTILDIGNIIHDS